MIGYLESFPEEADQNAEVMRQHFDGMSPGWIMSFNSGLAKIARKNWYDALRFFKDSLYFYPSFEPGRTNYNYVYPLAPLPRRKALMKRITGEGSEAIGKIQSNIKILQSNIQTQELSVANIILSEKVKLNIPESWVYDLGQGLYLTREEVGDRQVVEIGATKVAVIPTQMQEKK